MKHRTEIINAGDRVIAECSCGWVSKIFNSLIDARSAAANHKIDSVTKTDTTKPR